MFHMLDMRPGQPAYMAQLARAFEALRQALTCLQLDYQASWLAVRKPANVPYPLLDSIRQVSCRDSKEHGGVAHAASACMAFLWHTRQHS